MLAGGELCLHRAALGAAKWLWPCFALYTTVHSNIDGAPCVSRRIVTFCAVPLCIGMAIYDLSGTHEHHEEVPDYPYLRIR